MKDLKLPYLLEQRKLIESIFHAIDANDSYKAGELCDKLVDLSRCEIQEDITEKNRIDEQITSISHRLKVGKLHPKDKERLCGLLPILNDYLQIYQEMIEEKRKLVDKFIEYQNDGLVPRVTN